MPVKRLNYQRGIKFLDEQIKSFGKGLQIAYTAGGFDYLNQDYNQREGAGKAGAENLNQAIQTKFKEQTFAFTDKADDHEAVLDSLVHAYWWVSAGGTVVIPEDKDVQALPYSKNDLIFSSLNLQLLEQTAKILESKSGHLTSIEECRELFQEILKNSAYDELDNDQKANIINRLALAVYDGLHVRKSDGTLPEIKNSPLYFYQYSLPLNEIIQSPENGNCFFDSLGNYFFCELTTGSPKLKNHFFTKLEKKSQNFLKELIKKGNVDRAEMLRKELVEYLRLEYKKPENSSDNFDEIIKKYTENGSVKIEGADALCNTAVENLFMLFSALDKNSELPDFFQTSNIENALDHGGPVYEKLMEILKKYPKNEDQEKAYEEILQWWFSEGIELYCAEMEKDTVWANSSVLGAAVRLFKMNINNVSYDSDNSPTCSLMFKNKHYELKTTHAQLQTLNASSDKSQVLKEDKKNMLEEVGILADWLAERLAKKPIPGFMLISEKDVHQKGQLKFKHDKANTTVDVAFEKDGIIKFDGKNIEKKEEPNQPPPERLSEIDQAKLFVELYCQAWVVKKRLELGLEDKASDPDPKALGAIVRLNNVTPSSVKEWMVSELKAKGFTVEYGKEAKQDIKKDPQKEAQQESPVTKPTPTPESMPGGSVTFGMKSGSSNQ